MGRWRVELRVCSDGASRLTFGGSLVQIACSGDFDMTFRGSLVRSARFGDLTDEFWRKSRTKRWLQT